MKYTKEIPVNIKPLPGPFNTPVKIPREDYLCNIAFNTTEMYLDYFSKLEKNFIYNKYYDDIKGFLRANIEPRRNEGRSDFLLRVIKSLADFTRMDLVIGKQFGIILLDHFLCLNFKILEQNFKTTKENLYVCLEKENT